jgi:NADH-quinone oxidoreductase subunit J|tara:strand:- start:839 stop:1345 length:507 start_codon:yes stop_codon:yes gene_type:complete
MIEFFDIIFIVISVFTILTAILSLESRELMYGAMSLAASFLGVAGLFVLLNATFLAMLQILVFVGAIAVLILFTVMLVRRDKWIKDGNIRTRLLGLVTAVILSLGLIFVGMISNLNNWFANDIILSFIDIGNDMILNYSLVLNILAVVLGVSIIGALTMAKLDKGDKK